MHTKKGITKPDNVILQQLTAIATHLKYYLTFNLQILAKRVPIRDLLILKYPFSLPDAKKPPVLSIDITDACDIKCVYCNNPLFPHPRTMMSDEVVSCLLSQLDKHRINRIRIGGGEPTLHPRFSSILNAISQRTRYLSMITNCQWSNPSFAEEILKTNIDLLEISIDAGGAKVYEASRQNAGYDRLISNLKRLHSLRNTSKSAMKIKVRLMLRPSTRHLEKSETAFLKQYCDFVLPQFVMQHPETDYTDDVYKQHSITQDTAPVCSVPFKDLQIRPNGQIPLCAAKGCALDPNQRLFIGHICDDDIVILWNSNRLKELRNAHRNRINTTLEICKNCHYG